MRDFVMDGYVQRDVEDRATKSGRIVTRFSVNSPDYDRQSGSRTPNYFDVEYWHDPQDDRRRALQEGALVMLWGRFRQDRWQDRQTGQNRSKVVFDAREVAVIRPPQPAGQPCAPQSPAPQRAYQQAPVAPQPPAAPQAYPQQAYAPQPPAAPAQPAQQPPVVDIYDEDIPF